MQSITAAGRPFAPLIPPQLASINLAYLKDRCPPNQTAGNKRQEEPAEWVESGGGFAKPKEETKVPAQAKRRRGQSAAVNQMKNDELKPKAMTPWSACGPQKALDASFMKMVDNGLASSGPSGSPDGLSGHCKDDIRKLSFPMWCSDYGVANSYSLCFIFVLLHSFSS